MANSKSYLTAWKTDDKEWMKARKEAWKVTKKKIDKLIFPGKEEKKHSNNIFLLARRMRNIR